MFFFHLFYTIPGGILAHAFHPPHGLVHFDNDENFSISPKDGIGLDTIATHEIGHSLGMTHSTEKSALMYPFYVDHYSDFVLSKDDINGIQNLYGK